MPTPAVLSRTQTPSFRLPSAASTEAAVSTVIVCPPRITSSRTVSLCAPPMTAPSVFALSTVSPFAERITSPARSSRPFAESETTSTPRVLSATPTACPPGISLRASTTFTRVSCTGISPSSEKVTLVCPPASALSVTRSSCEASTLTAPPADAARIGRPVCTTSRCPEESVSASGSAAAFRTHGE